MREETVKYSSFRLFALAAMVVVTTSTASILIAPAPLIPTIFQSMNWDPGVTTAVTMLTFQICVCVFAFLGGFLVDKLGPVKVWIISLIVLLAGLALVPVIGNTVTGLMICRILNGAGTGPVMASIISFCAQRFPFKERTLVAAFQGFSVSSGIAIGLVFSPMMLKVAGGNWQLAMVYDGIIPVIALVFALIVLFGPKPAEIHEVREKAVVSAAQSKDLKKALMGVTFWMLLIMMVIDSWCQQAWVNIAPAFYASPTPLGLGIDSLAAGQQLSWGSYAMMAGTLLTPFVTAKIFKGNFKMLITSGLLISAAGMFFFRGLNANSGAMLTLLPVLVLFFSSFVNPNVVGYIARNYPDTVTGRLGGFVNAGGPGGAAVGVAIGSALLSKYQSFLPNMNVLTALFIVGAVAVWFVVPPKGFEAHLASISNEPANLEASEANA